MNQPPSYTEVDHRLRTSGSLPKEPPPQSQFSLQPAGIPSQGYYPGAPPPPRGGAGYPPQAPQYPVQIGARPTSGLGGTAFHQPGPVIVYAQNEVDSVSDYFIANIIACLLCCWCVGCFAILKSHECQNAKRNHDVERARKLSHDAKNLLIATIVVGIICGIIGGVVNALNNAGLFA